MIFPEMIDCSIDHDFPEPAFKGAHRISISGFKPVYLNKYFQESVIEDLGGVFFVVGIAVADRHSISVERGIDFFLTLPVVQDTSPDIYFQFLLGQQFPVGLKVKSKKHEEKLPHKLHYFPGLFVVITHSISPNPKLSSMACSTINSPVNDTDLRTASKTRLSFLSLTVSFFL